MMKVYDYSQLSELNKNETAMINIGLAFYFLGNVDAIYNLKKEYPNALILMDLKCDDYDYLNAKIAFDAGADVVSVSGNVSAHTLRNIQMIADENNGHVLIHQDGLTQEKVEDADIMGISFIDNTALQSNLTQVTQYMNVWDWMNLQEVTLEASI